VRESRSQSAGHGYRAAECPTTNWLGNTKFGRSKTNI
jgi:hypothetical protein